MSTRKYTIGLRVYHVLKTQQPEKLSLWTRKVLAGMTLPGVVAWVNLYNNNIVLQEYLNGVMIGTEIATAQKKVH